MNLEDAGGLAEQKILSCTGWSELPHDAVLTHAYHSRRGRWVFQWKRKTDLYSSEVDRLLVWIRDDGSIEKVEISWFAPLEPKISESVEWILCSRGYTVATAPAQAIKEAVEKRAYEVTGKDITVLEWRRILRKAWVVEVAGDEFWVGKLSDVAYVLLNPDGEIVGWMILPTRAVSVSGFYGDACDGACPPCAGWCYLARDFKSYFEKWSGSSESVVWGMCPKYDYKTGAEDCTDSGYCESYISSSDFENAIKDHKCKFYACIAHGDYRSAWLGNEQGTQISICPVSGWWCDLVVESLLTDRGRMRFAFLGHCGAMDGTGENTFEFAFRKGQSEKTTVIGLENTTNTSWAAFHQWYPAFLKDLDENRDKKIGDAYDDACDLYPDIIGHIDITGDRNQTLRDIIQGDFCEMTV
ncbi:MAG: hypothetical protein DRJ69_02140 [Thermoprotei archaeon]|nr:MAG: hypothetical protein DRJ69_02140 [Thermoprotei archaeon]